MATSSRFSGGKGVSRVLSKLKVSIENGKYYEAHQMYRTIYFRYIALNRYQDLIELLYDGALELLRHKQSSSGADLATLWVDVLCKSDENVAEQYLERLSRLYELMPAEASERPTFLSAALKWSKKGSQDFRFGHPRLHQLVALILWKEKNYQQSWCHFLRSMDGDGCASMLVEYHMTQGFASEVDLFVAQAVLQFLCLQNKLTATVVLYRYTEQHPIISNGPPFLLPLLNFLWFLLLTVESGKLATFTVLCEQYQPSIRRDPSYSEVAFDKRYLDKIGQLFFGLPPPRPRHQGMFGNLIQSFLSGLEDDDDDDDDSLNGGLAAVPGPSRIIQAEDLD